MPGSRNLKRWEDIEDLLEAGIDVISTVNIQHLESLNDVVEEHHRHRAEGTVPDAWVRSADQIELVDSTPEALRRRIGFYTDLIFNADVREELAPRLVEQVPRGLLPARSWMTPCWSKPTFAA